MFTSIKKLTTEKRGTPESSSSTVELLARGIIHSLVPDFASTSAFASFLVQKNQS